MAFGPSGEGWAVGAAGTVLHFNGQSWSTEELPSEDAGSDVTSVAVAGGDAFAVAGGELVTLTPGGKWEPVSFAGGAKPDPETLHLVAGLPDGGVVAAGFSELLLRQSTQRDPTGRFEFAPQPIQGWPVALAPFEAGGQLRTYLSLAPTADADESFPPGDGQLLREGESGWEDLSRSQYAGGEASGDGAVKSDPVLAVATGSEGEHAWAVGGYDGSRDAAGQGTEESLGSRPSTWQSASIGSTPFQSRPGNPHPTPPNRRRPRYPPHRGPCRLPTSQARCASLTARTPWTLSPT